MPHKKILVYFTQRRVATDPFAHLPERREIYWSIFREGRRRGLDMYLGVKPTVYLGGMDFENVLFFTGEEFILESARVTFDAIYDRNAAKNFPPKDIDHKTLNSLSFKTLANNKDLTYALLREYMPQTFPLASKDDFKKALAHFHKEEIVVFKPVDGFGGKGVLITAAKNLSPSLITPNKRFILQKFIDTSHGVPGFAASYHDLRIMIINGDPTMLQVREPVAGGKLANMSQGGTSREILYEQAPPRIQAITSAVHPIIDALYSFPMYSIDFGIDIDGTPYIFEINDQVGLKTITGKNKDRFCKNLFDSLEKIANLPR